MIILSNDPVSAHDIILIRVRMEILGSQNCRMVGKSQPVLIMNNPVISPHTRVQQRLREVCPEVELAMTALAQAQARFPGCEHLSSSSAGDPDEAKASARRYTNPFCAVSAFAAEVCLPQTAEAGGGGLSVGVSGHACTHAGSAAAASAAHAAPLPYLRRALRGLLRIVPSAEHTYGYRNHGLPEIYYVLENWYGYRNHGLPEIYLCFAEVVSVIIV
jgi:hypothetical protein